MYKSSINITCLCCGRKNAVVRSDSIHGKNRIQKIYCPDCHHVWDIVTRVADDTASKEIKK